MGDIQHDDSKRIEIIGGIHDNPGQGKAVPAIGGSLIFRGSDKVEGGSIFFIALHNFPEPFFILCIPVIIIPCVVIKIGKGIIKVNTDITYGIRIFYPGGDAGKKRALKIKLIQLLTVDIVIRQILSKQVLHTSRKGVGKCKRIIFVNEALQRVLRLLDGIAGRLQQPLFHQPGAGKIGCYGKQAEQGDAWDQIRD